METLSWSLIINSALLSIYEGINQWPVDSPHKAEFWCFSVINLDKLLTKQSSYWWFETPWRSCVSTVTPLAKAELKIGRIGSCHFDNFRCNQYRKFSETVFSYFGSPKHLYVTSQRWKGQDTFERVGHRSYIGQMDGYPLMNNMLNDPLWQRQSGN